MNEEHPSAKLKRLDTELRQYVKTKLREMEEIANKHGIVYSFTGLPPFDEYGNSGYYFPVKEDGTPWVSSDLKNQYYPLEDSDRLEGWISSNAGC